MCRFLCRLFTTSGTLLKLQDAQALKSSKEPQDAPQTQAVLQASSRNLKLQPFKLERRLKPSRRASTSRLQEDLKNSSRASSPQVASRPRVQVLKPQDAPQKRWSVRCVTLFITPDADLQQLYYMFPSGPQCRHIKTSVGYSPQALMDARTRGRKTRPRPHGGGLLKTQDLTVRLKTLRDASRPQGVKLMSSSCTQASGL